MHGLLRTSERAAPVSEPSPESPAAAWQTVMENSEQCNMLGLYTEIVKEKFGQNPSCTINKEESWFTKVYSAGITMADRHPGQVTLLFDIDHTIVDPEDIIRPAFHLAVQKLAEFLGDRLEIGFLSNKREGHLEESVRLFELQEDVGPFINHKFVISSSGLDESMPELFFETQRKLVDRIIDPKILDAPEGDRNHIDKWFQPKAAIIQALVNSYPDRAFVSIDDHRFPAMFATQLPNLIGVRVFDEVHDPQYNPPQQSGIAL